MEEKGLRGEEKLFNFRPILFGAIFFALGILFYFYHRFNGFSAWWLLLLLFLAGLPFCFCKGKSDALSLLCKIGIVGSCFFLGVFSLLSQTAKFQRLDVISGEYYVSGIVTEKRLGDNSAVFVLKDVAIEEKKAEGKLVLCLPFEYFDTVELCDEVLLTGDVRTRTVNEKDFLLQASYIGKEIRYETFADECVVAGSKFDFFLWIRSSVERALEMGMDKTPSEVMKGVLLGATSEIEDGLFDNIRFGGVSHIFAVSGLHVGSLFGLCMLAIKKTGLRRTPKFCRFLLVSLVLFLYAGVCGFTSSVVRATVICTLLFAFDLLGMKSDFLERLGTAAFFILFLKPSALFEVGFQLSFAACFGIAFLSKPIGQVLDEGKNLLFKKKNDEGMEDGMEGLLLRVKAWRACRDFFAVSLAAQIFTAPLLLYHFGYVSCWALLLNCIFVPLISAGFLFVFGFALLATLLPIGWASVILYVPNLFWSALLLLFQGVDFSSFAISGLKIGGACILPYFIGCLFCSDKWNFKKSFKRMLAIACFLAFAVGVYAMNV